MNWSTNSRQSSKSYEALDAMKIWPKVSLDFELDDILIKEKPNENQSNRSIATVLSIMQSYGITVREVSLSFIVCQKSGVKWRQICVISGLLVVREVAVMTFKQPISGSFSGSDVSLDARMRSVYGIHTRVKYTPIMGWENAYQCSSSLINLSLSLTHPS